MRVLDLFSGIGGFSIGLESAGMETVAFCEQNPFCQKILAQHWPTLPIHSDITELNGYEYRGTVELVCGGFPCQPFSVAGKQLGAEDDRALWPEMLRVIREVAPRWVIGENVSGIIPMELDKVLSDLEGEGYAARPFIVPACAADAPHRRDRVWIIARNVGDTRRTSSKSRGDTKAREKAIRSAATSHHKRSGEDVADTDNRHRSRKIKGILDQSDRQAPDRLARSGQDVAHTDSAQQQGRWISSRIHKEHTKPNSGSDPSRQQATQFWLPEPAVGRVANGIPRRVDRLRGLGNAIVPQIAMRIGETIKQCETRP